MAIADDNELDAFWEIAREHAHLSGVPVFSGANPVRTLRPPAWASVRRPSSPRAACSRPRRDEDGDLQLTRRLRDGG